jgi:hypothetical protein
MLIKKEAQKRVTLQYFEIWTFISFSYKDFHLRFGIILDIVCALVFTAPQHFKNRGLIPSAGGNLVDFS